jgi:hypothetical protein
MIKWLEIKQAEARSGLKIDLRLPQFIRRAKP